MAVSRPGTASGAEIDEARAIAHPFEGLSRSELQDLIDRFSDISEIPVEEINRATFLAQGYQSGLSSDNSHPPTDGVDTVWVNKDELTALTLENESLTYSNFLTKFKAYPRTTRWIVLNCSLGAMVQGFDETAVNTAQLFYKKHFGLESEKDRAIIGLLTASPYAVSAVACLFNEPLNQLLQGRRGVICATCFISFVTCLGQAFPTTWQMLLVWRLLLGLGIGPKSATIPIYASETMPAQLRGGLVMMWQMWTAFGIFLGFVFGAAFQHVDKINWRLMLAAPMVPPLIPMLYIFTLPESPRFLLRKAIRAVSPDGESEQNDSEQRSARKKYIQKAYAALIKLYPDKLQAARELMLIYHGLKNYHGFEKKHDLEKGRKSRYTTRGLITTTKLFTHARTRNALIASATTMFLQQFCGVNVMAYYSSSVLHAIIAGGATDTGSYIGTALYLSLGFGLLNFLAAFPAVVLMDKWGRRRLLLLTFPLMAICLFVIAGLTTMATTDVGGTQSNSTQEATHLTAMRFYAREADNNTSTTPNTTGTGVVAGVVVAMYVYCIIYSVGEGPVPFVYASESMPLQHRDAGMGVVTFINWSFNFLLGMTWPSLEKQFKLAGAFSFYGGWCVFGWFLVFIFVRETRGYTLEQLDRVFAPSIWDYVVKYAWPSVTSLYQRLTDDIDVQRPIWPQDEPAGSISGSSAGSTPREPPTNQSSDLKAISTRTTAVDAAGVTPRAD